MLSSELGTQTPLASRMFSLTVARFCVGYLLFKVLITLHTEAAPLDLDDNLCTPLGLQQFLNGTDRGAVPANEDIEMVYDQCRIEFLHSNAISPVVKKTIDDWVGTDLSKAETNQLFLAYELALLGPRPEKVSPEFEQDCNKMAQQFEWYRDVIEPLTSRVDIDLDSLLSDASEEVDDEERDLLNYVQYVQFCTALVNDLNEEENPNVEQ